MTEFRVGCDGSAQVYSRKALWKRKGVKYDLKEEWYLGE